MKIKMLPETVIIDMLNDLLAREKYEKTGHAGLMVDLNEIAGKDLGENMISTWLAGTKDPGDEMVRAISKLHDTYDGEIIRTTKWLYSIIKKKKLSIEHIEKAMQTVYS